MNISFDNRVAIITGAAHGFGRAIARAFAQRGATVHICDINEAGLAETRALCGTASRAHVVDVGNREAVHTTTGAIEAEAGKVDILSTTPAACAARSDGRSRRFRGRIGTPFSMPTCRERSS